MQKTLLPSFLEPFFWSYHLADLDIEVHRILIIKQILNHGSKEAVDWLRQTYSESAIREVISGSMVSEWSVKSLTFWSKMYNTRPTRQRRFA